MTISPKKQISSQAFEKLKKELEYLKKTKRREISEKLRHAVSFGDLKENAAYHEAKDEQAFLEGRILEIDNKIKNLSIITLGEKTDKVTIGSKVSVLMKEKKEEYEIVEALESDPLKRKISSDSPLGATLLNKKIKDSCFFVTPSGEKIEIKILEIN